MKRTISRAGVVASLLVLLAGQAFAIPGLQVYIDGATYAPKPDETWVTTNNTFTIWILGTDEGNGNPKYPIYDVKLSAAVLTSEINPDASITLSPTVTGKSETTDTTIPIAPVANPLLSPSGDGAVPVTGAGTSAQGSLEKHGIYGGGVSYFEWYLGDFTETGATVADLISSYPATYTGKPGQINAYTVTITGFTWVHFDSYDTYVTNKTHAIFAPYSHDGEGGGGGGGGGGSQEVPEPVTLLLLGSGLVGLGLVRRRKA